MLIPEESYLPDDARVWIFGYGSLLWKPGFVYNRRILGFIDGFTRRFWQTNMTHRGTPEKPGRVATLVSEAQGKVWGLAYEVVGMKNIGNAMKHLNGREIMCGGYTLLLADFHPDGEVERTFPVLAYTATAKNQFYNGPISVAELAQQVVAAKGPAGYNAEYILRIAEFMKEHVGTEHDEHLAELDVSIRHLLREQGVVVTHLLGDGPICTCDRKSVIHKRNCSANDRWALHRDVIKTVGVLDHGEYTDLSEIFARSFSMTFSKQEHHGDDLLKSAIGLLISERAC